jgi:hypothetical protein
MLALVPRLLGGREKFTRSWLALLGGWPGIGRRLGLCRSID